MESWELFLSHQGKRSTKWSHYFTAYDRHFGPWRGKHMTFLEIGVWEGGSTAVWKKYFGPNATLIGIDIDPSCKEHEIVGTNIRIGDQSDTMFLQSIIDEFGIPDIVLDDGSHRSEHINASFEFLYPQMRPGGIYMIEDLHCSYWLSHNGGINHPTSFMNLSKDYLDQLNVQHTEGWIKPNPVVENTFSMCFYDSLAVFEKGNKPNRSMITERE